ncbi:tetratricopeptide repeat protein [Qipengyuania sediminis]|uniref:tetratricopeptide repeat protein n=1 Tax=Qipengyuania sediminis TaxID=1532023 RepID=UPI00105A14A6|nr:tetratricopeptide repeat protein [Qipengyuania sediminis]
MLLHECIGRPVTTRTRLGQSFVFPSLPARDRLIAISLPLLLLAACTSPAEKAAEEAALAQTLFDAGNLPLARAAVSRALSHGGDSADILLLDARIKMRMQDWGPAYEAYRTVLVFQPNNLEALSVVARLGLTSGEKEVARDALDRGLKLAPGDPELLLTAGVMSLGEEDYADALRRADRILAASPGDPRGLALRARALTLTGRGGEALGLLRAQIAETGNDPTIASALLEVARAQGDVPTMLEQFALLVAANPDSSELVLDEINVRYKSGDAAGARFAARDFIARFGAEGETMARLLTLWEEYDPAPLAPDQIATLAAGGAIEARLAAARFHLDRGKLGEAQALLAGSDDPRAAGLLARVRLRQGDAGGVAAARRIAEKDQTNCEALTAIAEHELAKGRVDAAVIPAQVVATQCRDRIDGYVILADAYARAKRPAAVERVSRDGIDAHPLDPRLTRRFAEWLVARGRAASAVAAARRLTTVTPSRESSWRVLASVCQRANNSVCAGDAARGLARARTTYQLDPLPGVRRPDPLFGRTWR